MKTIKFRAWDYKTKEMYTQNIAIHTFRFEKDVPWELVALRGVVCDYTDGQLMQFTGLLDKNGKEIYEGDILKIFGYVNEDRFITPVTEKRGGFWADRDYLGNWKEYMFEIIGNIYENPKLLKGDGSDDLG